MKVMKLENAKLMWTNFAGEERPPYNPAGRRNFCVLLPMDIAEQMIADGWTVSIREPEDPDDDPYAVLKVSLNYNNPTRVPKIKMITSDGNTSLDDQSVGVLDKAVIDYADIKISPWKWNFGGKTGVKAFLKTADVYIKDYFNRE